MTEERKIIRRPNAKKARYALCKQFRLVHGHYFLLKELAAELSRDAGRVISVSSLVRSQIKKLLVKTGKLKK